MAWRPLGSWEGSGDKQTESFPGDTGAFRIRWTTKNEKAPGSGHFTLTFHSAISGRPLMTAVEQNGNGDGTAYVTEDPRIFFAVVESTGLDWQFTVEEGVTR
jgi:hypothetical protein